MDVRTWTTISRLLGEALDLPPADRTTWLENLGAEYEAFKPRLRAMLDQAASPGATDFLVTLPKFDLSAVDDLVDESARERGPGAAVGSYRLLRELAAGGQGAVWLAARADGLINRPVAIKLPHGIAYRPDLAERMARERDILATLNHPHIARLYDAGVTPDGEPFLALEYVEGTTIDGHCARHGLDIEARLRLFLQVVHAVAYAHAQLVIHRDLKPSNVLVTAQGEVRLLDFGIAKMLDETVALDSTLTVAGGRAMTLRYASPEQISRQLLGVATDVYSLGVVLHELLSGSTPYAPARDSVAALEDAILHAEPIRPSEATTDPALRQPLRGDLDTIVLKALKKKPDDRYATANALGEDIDRFLEGRVVLARPDSRSYRARKFIARNRLAVGAASAVLAAIVMGAGVAVWQMLEANEQRDFAGQQQRRAEAFSEFMAVLLQDTGAGDRPPTVTELLDRGTALLERQQGIDESVAAHMRYEISRNYLLFNQSDRELSLLERSAEGARRLGDANLLAAAECSAAWSLMNRNRPAAEAKLIEAERAIARAKNVTAATLADCYRARSRLLQVRGDMAGAIAAVQTGLDLLEEPAVQTWSRRDLLMTQLSELLRATDRYKEALALSEKSLAHVRRSGRTGSLLEIVAMSNHAGNLYRLGEIAQAEEMQRELVSWVEQAKPNMQPLGIRFNHGFTQLRLGRPERAYELAEADLIVAQRAGNPTGMALSHFLASRALLALGRLDESRQRLDAAEAVWHTDRRMYARMLTEAALHRVEMHLAEQNVPKARGAIDETLGQLGYPQGSDAAGLDRALRLAAKVYMLAGDPSAAETSAARALELARKIARDERKSADVGQAALLRAQALADQGRALQAVDDAALAVEALGSSLGSEHADTLAASLLARLKPITDRR